MPEWWLPPRNQRRVQSHLYYATGGIPTTCITSAEDDLLSKLGGKTIQSLCDDLYLTQEKVPFTNAAGRGDDFHFEEMFFNGHRGRRDSRGQCRH